MAQLATHAAFDATAREFSNRLAILADRPSLSKEVEAGLATDTVDRDLLADATGVGEHARRLSIYGPRTLASVAKEEEARRAEQELADQIDKESATPKRGETVIGAHPAEKEVEEKPKEMTAGGDTI